MKRTTRRLAVQKHVRLFKVIVSPEMCHTVNGINTHFTRIIAGHQLHAKLTLKLILTLTLTLRQKFGWKKKVQHITRLQIDLGFDVVFLGKRFPTFR